MKKLLVLLFILNAAFVYAGDEVVNLSDWYKKDTNTTYNVYASDKFMEIQSNSNSIFMDCSDGVNCYQFMFEVIKVGHIVHWGKKNKSITNLNLGYGQINKNKVEKLNGLLEGNTLLITGENSKKKISIPIVDLTVLRDLYFAQVMALGMAEGINEMQKNLDNATKEFEKNMNKAIDELNK